VPIPMSAPAERPHLASLLEDFHKHGEQIATVSHRGLRKQSTSYGSLARLAGRFASELNARGIQKGDRVLIWGENGTEWVAAFFGCILLGVIAVPIDAGGSQSFARRVSQEVTPKLVAGGQEQLALLEAELPMIAFEDFPEVLRLPPLERPITALDENEPVQIVFTSGATGDPKGVVHTHRNILASLRPIELEMQKYLKYERIFHPLRFLHTLPLSHVFGQFMGIWIPALLAAEVHFESRLIPGDLVETIRKERISVLATVPRVLEILNRYLADRFADLEARTREAESLPAWRRWWIFRDVHRALGFKFWAVVCGGATLPAHIEQFWRTLGLVVVQGYGMTETTALVSLNHPFHPAQGSIGKVLPGREIRLTDEGEILVRGETVSKATWEQGRLQFSTSDWLATGDLATMDEAGNLKFRGRKKEVIVTASGLNIYPDDLEAALLRQPEIRAAAIVEAEATGSQGSEPLAALVLRTPGDPAAAVRAANRELADYQHIRRWVVWPDPDLPRTSTGKIMHGAVAEALRNMTREDGNPRRSTGPPSGGTLANLIHRITGENIGGLPDSAFLSEDLHLDSLGRVELQSALENQLGQRLDDTAYQQIRTLGELRGITAHASPASTARTQPRDENIYPLWPWTRLVSSIRILFIELVMRPLVALLAKPRIVRDLDDELSSPVLMVANHVTVFDVPLILYALPRRARHRVAVAMAGGMLQDLRHARRQGNLFLNLLGPIQYFLATVLFNVFPLPQEGDFRKGFAHAGRAMDRGLHVLVFPEGRRTQDGLMHPFQGGAGILWKELRTKALPVYLGGLAAQKAKKLAWFRSGRTVVRIGGPLMIDSTLQAADATRILEQSVRQLGPESSR
jgi:long-chain acyl-CoA synthetase